MIENITYPFKVWITSVLVGPFLTIAQILIFDADNNTALNGTFPLVYLAAIVIGGLLSVPCFVLMWLCYHLLTKYKVQTRAIRLSLLFLSLISCIAVFPFFSLIDLADMGKWGNIGLIAAYVLPLAFGVTVYKLEKR